MNDDEVSEVICNYFKILFTSSQPTTQSMELALEGVSKKVIKDMNQDLDRIFTPAGIAQALWQMNPVKSTRPERFSRYILPKKLVLCGRQSIQTLPGYPK